MFSYIPLTIRAVLSSFGNNLTAYNANIIVNPFVLFAFVIKLAEETATLARVLMLKPIYQSL